MFEDLTIDNYLEVFDNFKTFKYVDGGTRTVYFEEMFLNSLLYAGGGALMQTLCTAIVAYLTAKYDNLCSKIVHYTVIVTLSLPIVGNLASMLQISKALGLFDNIVGSWIMKFGFNNIYYLIFYAFFKKVPWEYAESAFLDGASNWKVFVKIMAPQARPIIVSIAIVTFISCWNDYYTPYIYLNDFPTVAYGLNAIYSKYSSSMPYVFAAMTFTTGVVLIVFCAFSKMIMNSMSAGGLKG